jgi:hypothetical protein
MERTKTYHSISKKQQPVILDDRHSEVVNPLELRRRELKEVREVVCRVCGKGVEKELEREHLEGHWRESREF